MKAKFRTQKKYAECSDGGARGVGGIEVESPMPVAVGNDGL